MDIEVLIDVFNVMYFDLLINEFICLGVCCEDGKCVCYVKKFGKDLEN